MKAFKQFPAGSWGLIGTGCALVLAMAGALVVGCSSNGTTSSSTSGTAALTTVHLSDPATCSTSGGNGTFAHVYVTITDVKASVNAGAGDNDTSFVDLTPGLSSAPKQIDLLGQANNQCFLSTLGSTQQLQAGSYQQIRVMLADNSASVSGNACNGAANCVVLKDGSVHTLQLSSESKTGIKIPSGQIASGGFTIGAGQTKDLNIDFNTCVSIVQQGNGQYRLKPVLHAGEVSTTATSINGTVVDSTTGKAVSGTVLVALEQKDASGVDRVYMNTLTDASGGFTFCPLPSGSYDVVVVGTSSAATSYAPSVVTGVAPGSSVGTVSLHAQVTPGLLGTTLQGTITSANSAPAGTSIDAQVSALETLSNGLVITVPLMQNSSQQTSVAAVATASGSCTTGTYCATYSLLVPAAGAYSGSYSSSGATLTQGAATASYVVDALAFVPSSGGTADCSNSELKSAAVTAASGLTVNVPTLAFTGCQ